jgi:hypothetical protein|tara:strand:- start:66 stop:257 length:192 start_codon:yes stop_codon:yes gene_type:complete
MFSEAFADDRQDILIHETGNRILGQALLLAQFGTEIVEIYFVESRHLRFLLEASPFGNDSPRG